MPTKKEKQESVSRVKKDLARYKTVAIATIASLPAKHYLSIKKQTRNDVKIEFARQTLLKRALEESGRLELKPLEGKFQNGAVIIVSDLDAFKLYALFKRSKSKTFAKPGAIAPSDIVVPAGETNLAPGPVLTELKQAKIDARIKGTKVTIAKDVTVAKKGEPISEPVAKILMKLGIEPFEIGIGILSVYDNGTIYEGAALDIDEEAFLHSLTEAHRAALNLCVFAEIWNETSAPLIIQKAAREANAIHKLIETKKPATEKMPAAEAAQVAAPAGTPAVEAVPATGVAPEAAADAAKEVKREGL
ncbi:50S ribosomal protein L10 [Candidatus Micrarchaeota archaeon CG10_big_fil_rev_8_21_14_0_10_59_7]|nr:MAG: 50S ribosomal protein L10 [Candidatus Micrarchaeota archaeon CG10_big_fil_rev_8_21_14_0_10_59_7]